MTTEFMQVTLSNQPADARWGEKALLSTDDRGMTIHLTGNDKLGASSVLPARLTAKVSRTSNWPAMAGIWRTAGRSGKVSAGQKASAASNGLSCRKRNAKSWNSV